jgi:hypothetical protein
MRIVAPSLKLNMDLRDVQIKEDKPVIICRVGVYDATTDLSPEDLRTFLKCLCRPRILIAFLKLAFGKSKQSA